MNRAAVVAGDLAAVRRLGSRSWAKAAPVKEEDRQGSAPRWQTRVWFRVAGVLLVLLAVVGFATLADDLRHVGEILAVMSILVAGLALVGASFPNPMARRLALPWLAVGSVGGSLIGAASDQMVFGVTGGILLGLILGATQRSRGSR